MFNVQLRLPNDMTMLDSMTYDCSARPLQVFHDDGTSATYKYGFGTDAGGLA